MGMKRRSLIKFAAVFSSFAVSVGACSALAALTVKAPAPVTTIPEVGPHTPLIKVEKNENPQNTMVVYTKIDEKSCAFAQGPVLDEYWMMDGSKYKPVNPMIKSGIKKRFELDDAAYKSKGRFLVKLRDFSELKSDLGPEPTFEVLSTKAPGGCSAKVQMTLGASDHERKIEIESIYADSSKTVLPPFRKLNALTLIGRDVATGEKVRRTYSSR
jgi:hypothetical protein